LFGAHKRKSHGGARGSEGKKGGGAGRTRLPKEEVSGKAFLALHTKGRRHKKQSDSWNAKEEGTPKKAQGQRRPPRPPHPRPRRQPSPPAKGPQAGKKRHDDQDTTYDTPEVVHIKRNFRNWKAGLGGGGGFGGWGLGGGGEGRGKVDKRYRPRVGVFIYPIGKSLQNGKKALLYTKNSVFVLGRREKKSPKLQGLTNDRYERKHWTKSSKNSQKSRNYLLRKQESMADDLRKREPGRPRALENGKKRQTNANTVANHSETARSTQEGRRQQGRENQTRTNSDLPSRAGRSPREGERLASNSCQSWN